MSKSICGAVPKKHPEMKCCVAYVPKEMKGDIGMGFKVSDASDPHWHFDLVVLNDGTILSYKWKGRGERFGYLKAGRGCMERCTAEDYDRMVQEIGVRPKKIQEVVKCVSQESKNM